MGSRCVTVPVSRVTRSLARLEADCGARLLHRTTHGLSLTDEGDTVLAGSIDKPHGLRECIILDHEGYAWVPGIGIPDKTG